MESFDVAKVASALDSNRELQATIRAELRHVRELKALNRLKAASITEHLIDSKKSSQCLTPSAERTEYSFNETGWSRRFFEDPHGGRAQSLYDYTANDQFFHRFRPPWQTKESKDLVKTVKSAIEADFPLEERYQRVASVLKTPKHGTLRSAEECKVEFERQCEKPFTKDELKRLVSSIDESSDEIAWKSLADTLSVNRSVSCTPFQCLAACKKVDEAKKKKKNSSVWTSDEDSLLLKFMLASGSQLMLDYQNPFFQWTFPVELFPDKTKKQVFDRINGSSLNPRLADGEWTDFEERKLTVLMKIYRGDVLLVSKHMNRALKAVSDKWQRTLNPEYSTIPFSKEDDAKLISIIRSQPQLGWRDISRDHFPDRHPQRLMNRWSDLATDADIIAREENTRKRSKRMKAKRF